MRFSFLKKVSMGIAALVVCSVSAFSMAQTPPKSAGAERETAATNQLLDQAAVAVGVPAVMNFTEKRQLRMLYELRDQANLVTYSYYVDINGRKHKVCPETSVGFGMPFSAQFTAPSVDYVSTLGGSGASTVTRHQPEPNGLYMPDSTSATWVICLNESGDLAPVYVEPAIIVSLTPMKSVD